ncbi:CHAT domain-containing protein [Suillus occidentalis]|nr:CHAT domain-containing protein [Suillus occidentalis]
MLLYRSIIPGRSKGRYIRLEVINGKSLQVPSRRDPAGIYVSIKVGSRRCWKSTIGVLSSDQSVTWGDTVTLSSHTSHTFKLSVEIRASFELERMLGNGEVVGKLKISWDKLLDHGDEPFDLPFPSVHGVYPSLTLKAAVVHACDIQDGALPDSLVACKLVRDTDAGHARLAKYVVHERVFHLTAALQHFQSVLDRCPVNHPDHGTALTNLAYAHLRGYGRMDLQDIDRPISLFREALALRPQRHPDHLLSLLNLAEALIWRHGKKSTAADICEAAHLYHELISLCPEGTYLCSVATMGRGVYNVIKECLNLPRDASDEDIHLRRIVLEFCPLGHQLRLRALDELLTGNSTLSLCSEGHADRSHFLHNLASSLLSRFNHQGKPNDLDEAICSYEEVLCLRPAGHKFHDSSMCNLGNALVARYNTRNDIDDITRAISLYREALTLHSPGHPDRDATLGNLANALNSRYAQLHVSEDLYEATELYRESLHIMQLDRPGRHVYFFNLSAALCSRFRQTQKNEDVEEAIALCQASLEGLSSLHPDRFFSYMRLSNAYSSRYRILHDPADLLLAIENLRLASGHPTQGFPLRIKEAIEWARQAEVYQHESALEAYQMCFELFESHVMTRSSIISRREAATAFRGARSLPVDAASCAIRRGNLRQAVELVEQGRGQQWSLASRLRTPLEDLKIASPQLTQQLSELSKLLSDAQGSTGSADPAAADEAAIQYRSLTRQWDTAVAEIRGLRAFSRFLLPPSYEYLQVAARQGPVIILIASQYLCSAIIVSTSGGPHRVPLPSVTLVDLTNLKDRFARAIRYASGMGPKLPRNNLIVLLRTVWDEIMLPIVNVLERVLKLKRHSRIWLCPTAAFTSIPLHAAHPFRTNADCSKEPCLEDLYICSYTPTLSALVRSRQMMKKQVTPSFATIGQGKPDAGKALLAVDSELELVRKLVPVTANRTTISGDAATRTGALKALEENTWVHLACHGKQDCTQPYNSHFVMKDEKLTLLDIMERHVPQAEFAFLSACHTAVGDEETPDEVIHLAAGLQFSGFKSVVGTLWQDSKDGGVMDCTKAAWALNRATHAVKTKVPLEQRMVFVHIGV